MKILDFKFSPCSECCVLPVGRFPGVCSLNAYVSERAVWKTEQTQRSASLAFALQTPGNHLEEYINIILAILGFNMQERQADGRTGK
jgi:hypothetical protein